MGTNVKEFDVIIVGAGMAGLRAAIGSVKREQRVAVITKVHPLRSHSVTASGGVNAVLDKKFPKTKDDPFSGDSIDMHLQDTIACGHYFSDTAAVETLVSRGPGMIKELERWGCLFSRTKDNKIAQRMMGASSKPRTVYSADKTGHVMMNTLYEQCVRLRQNKPSQLQFFEEWFVLKLLVINNTAVGVIAIQIATGKMEIFTAKAVIWATGGIGRIYGRTSNPLTNSGWGVAVPLYAGTLLKDMEFIQFHPTQLSGSHILITEAARGEGAILVNRKGERFLETYDDSKKDKELSPRDIISRNIRREILAGRGVNATCVHLDMRRLGTKKIKTRLPGVQELCKTYTGLDPVRHLIPITPGQHYTIGGIHTNEKAETNIHGLFASGECACAGIHGANRMGGNSLLEALVFGEIASESVDQYIAHKYVKMPKNIFFENAFFEEENKIDHLLSHNGHFRVAEIRDKMHEVMDEHVGIYRDGMGLVTAAKAIKDLKNKYSNDLLVDGQGRRANYGLIDAIELKGSLDIADIIIHAALRRNESIGVHFRNDFPTHKKRSRHSLSKINKGKIKIRYIPVKSKDKLLKTISAGTILAKK